VMEKRDALKVWTIFLAILVFSLSLLGTFLVRSGVLTSVHAFASDPRRGVFILMILAVFIAGPLALFAWRAPMLRQGGLFAPISREGALVLNNLLLTTVCAIVFFGTLYPLALEQLTGEKISVGAPFFNLTAGVLLMAVAFATPFGFSLAWKRGDLLGVAQRLAVAFAGGFVVLVGLVVFRRGGPALAPIAAALAIFVMLGTLSEVASRVWRRGASLDLALARAAGLPLSFWGGALAHLGAGVALLGLASVGFGAETIAMMKTGDVQTVGPYEIALDSIGDRPGPNYRETVATMTIRKAGAVVATVEPARRLFSTRQMATTQAGIVTLNLGQVYVAVGDPNAEGAVAARLYWKPLVTLIWLGAMVMACGGALSLADRRLRFGAPAPARARTLAAELRCLVCQNQSIDDSDAPLARDIRLLIRQRIGEGESNADVRAFLVSRYGNFILLKPPFEGSTALLWLSGPLTLALGALGVYFARRRAPPPPPPLTAEEEKRLAELARD